MHSELAERLARYTLVPETIFAYRFSKEAGWLLEAWECTQEEVIEETKLAGWELDDLQVLREHKIVKGLNGYFLLDVALSQHWLRDYQMDHWVPMDHCLTPPDDEPTAAGVALSLSSITKGSVAFEARSPAITINVQLSSTQDDLADLIRFTDLLGQGVNPHLVFAGQGVNVFAVFPYHGTDGVRVRIRQTRADDEHELIDVVTSCRKLVAELRTLARDIAAHPCLTAQWFGIGAGSVPADIRWAEACKSALAAGDARFLDPSHAVRLDKMRREAIEAKIMKAAEDGIYNEELSDSQGRMFQLAVKYDGQDGWDMVNFVKSPERFLRECSDEGIKVSEHRVISECRARPVHKGTLYFGHTTRLEDEGWKYDRIHDCWRAPGEDIRTPSWSVPEAELRRRESDLAAITPSSVECRLKIVNEKGELLHEVVRGSPDGKASWEEYHKFHSDVGKYLEAVGLIYGPFESIWTVDYEVGQARVRCRDRRHRCERVAGEWKLEAIEETSRARHVIRIMPDYGGAYVWDEDGASSGLTYMFPEFPDVALVEAVLEDEWQPKFERAPEIEGHRIHLDLDWDRFHEEGLALAMRLKAILGEHADIAYEKPYEDPNRTADELRFIVPKDQASR